MKNIKYIIIVFVLLGIASSCEDVFDKRPLDKISDSDVWESEDLVRAYVISLYSRFPFFAFSHYEWFNYSDEATFASGSSYNNLMLYGSSRSSDYLPYWGYAIDDGSGNKDYYLRAINVFLENITDAPIPDIAKTQMEGEVRVMRAMVYYEMQKRYGGVPLVDIAINPFEPIDEKYTKRATEEQIADFINSEFEKAIPLLTENIDPRGQINKWTAYGLKARANLWSASIAKYGSVQLGGLVGIPSSRANEFFTMASQAADAVINSGNYSLYNKLTDKSENYMNIFMDEENSEIIFEEIYDGVEKGHSFDLFCAPPSVSSGRGGSPNPTLDFILGYENIDGSQTQPEFGKDHLYSDGFEPFQGKDPRLYATVFFQGDEWAGGTIQTYEAIDPNQDPNPNSILSNPSESYEGMPTVGADSRKLIKDGQSTNSGFIQKKYIQNEALVGSGLSSTNWIYMRLAEMYLIKAEAEFELGHKDVAATALNATRERAGISLVDASSITIEKVRTERRSELAFEVPFRYWDLRRWRTAEEVLGNPLKGLQIIYHYQTGKYYFMPIDCEDFTRVFRPEHYYQPITDNRIDNNPDLIENPGY